MQSFAQHISGLNILRVIVFLPSRHIAAASGRKLIING